MGAPEEGSIRVLHVDDDPDFADLAATYLERESDRLAVSTATSARDALDRLDDDVDCVVSDYRMPGVDGLEFLAGVRQEYPDLPFILFTAKGSEEVASEAISAGVTDYLQKGGSERYAVLANRIENVVAQSRAERAVRDERDRRAALFENSIDPILASEFDDEEVIITSVNEAFEAVFGYDAGAVVGETVGDLLVPAEERSRYEGIKRRVLEGDVVETEVRRETVAGPRDFLLRSIPLEIDTERTGTYAIYTDITERKERERTLETLHETTRRLMGAETRHEIAEVATEAARDVLGLSVNGVFLYDDDGHALVPAATTPETREVFDDGLPTFHAGEGLAWEVFEAGEPQVYDDVSTVPGAYNPETPIRGEFILPLGEHGVFIAGSPTPADFPDRDVSMANVLAANVEEALDRARRQQELKARENELERYKTIVEVSGDAVYALDAAGRFTFVNEAFEDLSGYSADELVGEHVSVMMDEADIERGERLIAGLLRDERDHGTFEMDLIRADGSRVTSEVHVALLPSDDGFRGTTGIHRDITERKQYERRLERQLEQVAEFGRVLSHDLRGPLDAIAGRLDLARETGDLDHLDAAETAVSRLDTLIEDVATVMREGSLANEITEVDVEAVFQATWTTLDTGEASLVVEDARHVRADENALTRLVENLLRNAIEHGGEAVTVRVGPLEDGFYVEDTGPGIPEDSRDEVFKPGFTTKDDGTGFGLVSIRQIALAHGWDIAVTDGSEGGARFEVTGVEPEPGR